jgi:uncharacterized protein YbjT (DUF2867 family)/uncharacterized protein YndB with AHSA1/START domain
MTTIVKVTVWLERIITKDLKVKMEHRPNILVTGATGYIGSRLVPRLLDAGYPVRVLARNASRLEGRTWFSKVEVVEGDVLRPETLPPVMQDIDHAYYFIHSMSDTTNFSTMEASAAENFGKAARSSGVERIIYLGGLGHPDSDLSTHLRSRLQTGEVLRESGVPVTEFRAAIIVGSGSISFEMIRYMTERVPIMITPRWVSMKVQPISIRNILDYLVQALEVPESENKIIEIGGDDVLTYGEMMQEYARIRGLTRFLIPVPVLTPRLSSYWLQWVTPLNAHVAKPLIEGLRNEVIVRENSAKRLFHDIKLTSYHDAVNQALEKLNPDRTESPWGVSAGTSASGRKSVQLSNIEGMIVERYTRKIPAPVESVFLVLSSISSTNNRWFAGFLWQLRGFLDRLLGGVGLRRGRSHPSEIHVGDALDFWRVEAYEPNRKLRIRAEMKVPGEAWLEFETIPDQDGSTKLFQTSYFAPRGLIGHLYWYALYPVHKIVFSGLMNAIVKHFDQEFILQTNG